MIALQMERRPDTATLLPLELYDHIIVSFSGGKDSLACLLKLLDMGVSREKLELWHQHVDGAPGSMGLMDWPITEDYCRKVAEAFGIPIYYQWRQGGFEREMLRKNQRTAPVFFQTPEGLRTAGGIHGDLGTRLRFPQKSANLAVRWCSPSLKIDVASVAVNNDKRFRKKKILVLTGERRQESSARAKYAEIERHRTTSNKWKRRTDQWRAVIDMSEADVWSLIKRHKVMPHPAYYLGWGRVSCMACIFGDRDQWASIRDLTPETFGRIMAYERQFGVTITKGESVWDAAMMGRSFVKDAPEELKALALSKTYNLPVFVEDWQMPKGAFRRCGGPT